MKLVDILPIERIKIPLTGKTKSEIISELVDIVSDSNPHIDQKVLLKAIIDRENMMSTGIGQGIAIPHAKSKGVNEMTASFGISPEGVDFESLDGKPVRLFFMIAAPDGPAGPHLRCLSMISRLLNNEDFRKDLVMCATQKDALRMIEEGEQEILK